jgi:hypothetical protein
MLLIGLLAFSLATMADVSDPYAQSALKSLGAYFSNSRLLPPGSRPRPPQVDLGVLIGLQAPAIKDALGPPDDRGENYPPLDCHATECWSFSYGPKEVSTPVSESSNGNMNTIRVTTGGPWLLICGFTNGQLVAAFWRGQK